MTRMNRNQFEMARRARVSVALARQFPDVSQQELGDMIEEEIESELQMEAEDRAEYLANVEDTPCLESADIWGTGEGRYHGII